MSDPRSNSDETSTSLVVQAHALELTLSSARGRLLERVHEVSRRAERVREALNVGALIRQHPLAVVGVSVAAGLLLGFARGGARRAFAGQAGAALGGIAMRLVGTALTAWLGGLVASGGAEPTAR